MRRLLIILLALLATGAQAEEQRFEYLKGGKVFGEERFRIYEFGDTLVVDGISRLGQPFMKTMRTRTIVHGPDDTLIDYLLWTESGDSIFILARTDSVLLGVDSTERIQEKTFPLEGRKAPPLDNTVIQHAWLLARQRQRDPSARVPLLALIPQIVHTSELHWREVETVYGHRDGESVTVNRHSFELAGVLQELELGPEGELLSLHIPVQDFTVRRAGYERPRPAPAAAEFPEEEITLIADEQLSMGGTLTLPSAGEGPFPACVILHGAGPIDRDLSYGPNRIYRQLAHGLAERGIASLRYDKRTWVISRSDSLDPEKYDDITLKEEVLDDALSAYALLTGDPRFDAESLFLLGHGLGGGATATISKLLAADGVSPAGLVMLAPIGRDLLTVSMDQHRYLNERGILAHDRLEEYEKQAENMRAGNVGEDNVTLFAKPRYWDSVLYWQPWRDYREQSAPALVLFGERDYQTTAPDRETWAKAFAKHPRAESRLELLPRLNHFFLAGEGRPGPAEYGKEGQLSPEFLDLIADWMRARLK